MMTKLGLNETTTRARKRHFEKREKHVQRDREKKNMVVSEKERGSGPAVVIKFGH